MNDLLSAFLEISFYCIAVIIFVALISKLTSKNYSSKWRYCIWIILALRLLLPFNLHIIEVPFWMPATQTNWYLTQEPSSQDMEAVATQTRNLNGTDREETTSNTLVSEVQEAQVSDQSTVLPVSKTATTQADANIQGRNHTLLFFWLWIVGIVSFLLYHGLSYAFFVKKLKRWKIQGTQEVTRQMFASLLKELKIKNNIKLEICKAVSSPMIVGVLHPKVVLPSEDFTAVQMKMILKHELIHYKHHDLFFKCLFLCVNAIHWFNPFVYYMAKLANHDMEMLCDEKVVWKQDEEYRRIYSFTILQTLTKQSMDKYIAFSSNFHGDKKKMKHRFSLIMNASHKKGGPAFLSALLCILLLTGSLVACGSRDIESKSAVTHMIETAQKVKTTATSYIELTKSSHILLVGTEGLTEGPKRSDCIMLLTIQPKSKKLTITSFLRDMYVEIPNNGQNRLNASFVIGGMDLLKETIETNFDIRIDGTAEVDFSGFESIIDELGGISLSVTEKEADFLNSTNYISDADNRNLVAGKQTLNGNQALGYTRIRHVENADGVSGDLGRTERQRDLILAIYAKYKTADLSSLIDILDAIFPYVTIDLEKKQIIPYIRAAMEPDYSLNSSQIPAKGTYKGARKENMSVLEIDLSANKEFLNTLIEP